jgi:gentisate 1,2-dioxygenase
MTTVTTANEKPARKAVPVKARELMEQLNVEAANLNFWLRTEMNAPAQRAWFADTTGAGAKTSGRIAANQLKALPYRWRWKEYGPYLDRISQIAAQADVPPIEFADRQSILLTNPGLGGRLQVTNTIRCAISIYNPGDIAPAHIHSPNASRTILSENGGYTNIEGERCEASRGDLILTPNGTWHDHGNDGDKPVVWIDMLDWPLMEFFDCAWVDQSFSDPNHPGATSQQETVPCGYSHSLYGTGGLKPAFVAHQRGWGQKPSPLFHYRGEDVRATLDKLRVESGDPYEGIIMQFVNPITGDAVFPTMNYSAQLLRSGEELQLKRETCGTFIVVIDGKGHSEIGGERFDWEPNDIMVVPPFTWRKHVNSGSSDAVLYTVTDAEVLRHIGQYRSQGKLPDGSVTQLVS